MNEIEIQQLVEQAESAPPPGTLRVNPKTGGIIAKGSAEARERMLAAIAQ